MIRKIKGLTLTELMVDLVLSSMVISAVLGLYINYKRSFNYQSDMMFMYQNAQSVYDYLNNDVQLAGFYGCDSAPDSIQYALTTSYDYNLSNIVTGYEATGTGINTTYSLASPASGWSPALQGQVATVTPNAGSDIVTIRFVDTNTVGVLSADTTGLTLASTGIQNNVAVGDKLLISDCRRTVVFQVATVSTNQITPTASVGSLNSGAEIYPININSYYVKTVNNISSLYRLHNGLEEMLVPYVENLQLLYGQDTNSDGVINRINTASTISANPINSILVSVLMRSIDKQMQTPVSVSSYSIMAAPTAMQMTSTINVTNDKYQRKVFDYNLDFPNIGGNI